MEGFDSLCLVFCCKKQPEGAIAVKLIENKQHYPTKLPDFEIQISPTTK